GLSMLGDRKPSAPNTPAPAPPVTPPGPPPPPAPPPAKPVVVPPPATQPDPDVERIHGTVLNGKFVPAVPKDPAPASQPKTSTGGAGKRSGPATGERSGAERKGAPQPSNRWLEQCRRDKEKRQEENDAAVRTYLDAGGAIDYITEGTELHHVASDKDSKYRPRFEEVFEGANVPGERALTLDSEENLVRIEGHQGPHGENYHKAVLKRLQDAVAGKASCTPEYRAALTDALKLLKKDLQKKGSYLNRLVTRK
ncbi:AHH domain-containing protein, partial [Streptomyces sp. NPDC059456]|uniref:AHH domain-containing protein n=1 Tax=Streptomyces sp. NPDC059456 TaxID=3346838 RepID=UPI0036A16CE1